VAAITLSIMIAVVVCVIATARYANPVDYVGPNLSSNQLVVYAPGSGPGPNGGAPVGSFTTAQVQAKVDAIAISLGTQNVLPLAETSATLMQRNKSGGTSSQGQIYIATPQVLAHYGINPKQINPATDLITARRGLAGTPRLELLYGPNPNTLDMDANLKVQTFHSLPTGTTDPNLLVTTSTAERLGLTVPTSVWLIQTTRQLTAQQVNGAREMASAVNATIETKNHIPSVWVLRNYATFFGAVFALGVLVMTVGLIRSEAANDLRVLTATGASSTTRRAITGATAGALAFLGAVLGTVMAYAAMVAWFRNSLSTTVAHVPVADLLLIVIGMPVVGGAGGWVFAGRQPPAIARQPLE